MECPACRHVDRLSRPCLRHGQHGRATRFRHSKRGIRSSALEKRQNSPPFLQNTCALVLNVALFSDKMFYVPLFSYTFRLRTYLIKFFFFTGSLDILIFPLCFHTHPFDSSSALLQDSRFGPSAWDATAGKFANRQATTGRAPPVGTPILCIGSKHAPRASSH